MAAPQPKVVVDSTEVRFVQSDGQTDSVCWTELRFVAIETNDGGPFIEDVYIHLAGPEYGFYVPQNAEGIDILVHHLTKLPGFQSDNFQQAMCSTANARFVCWQAE